MINSITEDKEFGYFASLDNVAESSTSDSVTLTWDTTISYENESVVIAYRLSDNTDAFTIVDAVSRDSGTITTGAILEPETLYTIWYRAETADSYSNWLSKSVQTTT